MERRPASASMQPPAAARGRMRPESAGRSRPQSAGVTADRLPLPPRMEAPAERVEYNGSSQRVEYTGSSMAGAADGVKLIGEHFYEIGDSCIINRALAKCS